MPRPAVPSRYVSVLFALGLLLGPLAFPSLARADNEKPAGVEEGSAPGGHANAGSPGASEGHGASGRSMHALISSLSLREGQRAKLDAIEKETRPELRAKGAAMRSARDALEGAIKGGATEKDLRLAFEALRAAEDAFSRARFEKILRVRAVLDVSQRERLDLLAKGGRGGRGRWYGRGGWGRREGAREDRGARPDAPERDAATERGERGSE